MEARFAVAQWLLEKDKGEYATAVCKSLQKADYPVGDWVQVLEGMPSDTLDGLLLALEREIETSWAGVGTRTATVGLGCDCCRL